jgi:predicted HNH restriction endonuclease
MSTPTQRKSRKLPTTPRSRIKNALRQVWLRSRERAAALKAAGHSCERCGVKASGAKGREQKVEVHHRDGINWDGIVDTVIRRMLPHPDRLEVVCPKCHRQEHEEPVPYEQEAPKSCITPMCDYLGMGKPR